MALSIDPNDKYAHDNMGNALWSLGKFDEAAASYHSAIQIDHNY